jgi:hypothetical protein
MIVFMAVKTTETHKPGAGPKYLAGILDKTTWNFSDMMLGLV